MKFPTTLGEFLSSLGLLSVTSALAAEHPNVLWITLEDTSPHFIGCYGNEAAKTPHIDSLAAGGIRFDAAFANAPVCSAARSTIITGALNETLGTGHHRSAFPLPDFIKGFPTFLREAGYYTSNNKKTDYSTSSSRRLITESWDENSGQASWTKRDEGQPFFSVFNIEHCHQSRTMTWTYDWYRENILFILPESARVADNAFEMPPFLPDTPEFRQHFARVYNSISFADQEVGRLLAQLDADGLREDTIIFCYADHGEAMPRGKANPIGLGYRVPFIISFPEKWQHLNPWGKPGSVTDELVNFDDLAPTMLSLVGKEKPSWMTGRALLGAHRKPAPEFIYCSRNRIDETEACSRSITDGRYLLTLNFLPRTEMPYQKYFDVADISRLLRKGLAEKNLPAEVANIFSPQPHEVLYDLKSDPWELKNLANNPENQKRVTLMRKELLHHIVDCRDIMIAPEYELWKNSQGSTPFEENYSESELADNLNAAHLASQTGTDIKVLRDLLTEGSDVASYWAATAFRRNESLTRDGLVAKDFPYPPTQIEIAAALYQWDGDPASFSFLSEQALSPNPHLRQQALNRIQDLGEKALPFKATLEKALKGGTYDTQCSAEMTLHILDDRSYSYPDPK